VTIRGRRRPPDEDREHDSDVIIVGTEDGRFGVAHHPSARSIGDALGESVRRIAIAGPPGIRAACLDALAEDVPTPDPLDEARARWKEARTIRAEMVADIVEDLATGRRLLLIGHSAPILETLRERGFDVEVVDAHPGVPYPSRPRDGGHDVTVVTGMVLSNGSIRTVLGSCSPPIILYSESCPNMTTCLVRSGAVDGAVVERFPFHFLPGETILESYIRAKG